jgi:hypothetical protein
MPPASFSSAFAPLFCKFSPESAYWRSFLHTQQQLELIEVRPVGDNQEVSDILFSNNIQFFNVKIGRLGNQGHFGKPFMEFH